jgi:magnesium chelatase subunit D
LFVLVSDGRPNVSLSGKESVAESRQLGRRFADRKIASVVVDTETSSARLGLAGELAQAMGGQYFRLEELEAGRLAGAVRQAMGRVH